MSAFAVTAEPLTIHPHPAADRLEIAQVGATLFRTVVGKGEYATGDHAIYIPEQAVLPPELLKELDLIGRLAGPGKDRVQPVQLRGELSRGIVCRPHAVTGHDLARAHAVGFDFAPMLDITKRVPPVPMRMVSPTMPAPGLLPWDDVQDLARFPEVFARAELVNVTEMIHGIACLLTYVADTDELLVTWKRPGARGLALVPSTEHPCWRAVTAHGVGKAARVLAKELGAARVGIFGEMYGPGLQDLHYGAGGDRTPGYAVFDIAIDRGRDGGVRWLSRIDQAEHLERINPHLALVPLLSRGPFNLAHVLALASGQEQVTGRERHMRAGVVVRADEERHSVALGGRAIVKVLAGDYLTREHGTEYQ